jgi:NCS1 nucleoside transporter family
MRAAPAEGLDAHTIAPIPEADKTSTALHQFWIWAGANVAPINWILGALGIVLGLGLWTTIIVIAIGNVLGMSLFGLFVLMGHKTGINQMVLSRSAFGRRGAYLPAAIEGFVMIGWVALNTWIILDVCIAILGKMGVDGGTPVKIGIVLVVMAIQVALGTFGFYAIRTFEKWTVPVTFAVVVAMTIVAWSKGNVDWGYAGTVTGKERITAISQLMTAIGIGWGISWLAHASDFARFVPRSVPPKKLYIAAVLGQFLPVLWLGVLGASLATTGTGADPAVMIVNTFGALALPVLLLVLHAPIAANILNIYSAGLAALTLDAKVARHKVCIALGMAATVFTLILVFHSDLASTVTSWLSGLVIWLSAWGSIMFVHFYVIRRGRIDIEALYDDPRTSRVGDINWRTMAAFAAGLFAGWLFEYGQVGFFQGPLSKALNQVDISWLAGMLVAGTTYYLLERKRSAPTPVPSLATAEPVAEAS